MKICRVQWFMRADRVNRIISTPDTGSDSASGGIGRDNVVSRKSVNNTDRKGQMPFQRRCAARGQNQAREQSDETGNGSTQSEKLVREGRAVGRIGGAKSFLGNGNMESQRQGCRKLKKNIYIVK